MRAEADGENPKDAVGSAKAPLGLIPGPALVEVAEVMRLGAEKYGPGNWRQTKVRRQVYTDAALRHIYQDINGEDRDVESGETHIAHAIAGLLILLDAIKNGTCIDDRGPQGYMTAALEQSHDINKAKRGEL